MCTITKKLSIVALCALLVYVESKSLPQPKYKFGDSYIDDITLSYEKGVWQCDMITCPLGVYGCKIQRRNSPKNRLQLIRTNICYHRNDGVVRSAFQTEAVPATRTVNINITSFEDAQSVYLSGYSLDLTTGETFQHVEGIIAADNWSEAQVLSIEVIKNVESQAGGSVRIIKY